MSCKNLDYCKWVLCTKQWPLNTFQNGWWRLTGIHVTSPKGHGWASGASSRGWWSPQNQRRCQRGVYFGIKWVQVPILQNEEWRFGAAQAMFVGSLKKKFQFSCNHQLFQLQCLAMSSCDGFQEYKLVQCCRRACTVAGMRHGKITFCLIFSK